jgi:hypothetical protein
VVLYTLAPLAAALYGGLITAYRPPSDHLRSVSDHTDEAERRQRFPDSEPNRSCRYSNKSYPRSLPPFKRMFMIVLMAIVMFVATHILGSVGGVWLRARSSASPDTFALCVFEARSRICCLLIVMLSVI